MFLEKNSDDEEVRQNNDEKEKFRIIVKFFEQALFSLCTNN